VRIAYVSLHWPRTRSSGVGKKIGRQLAAWSDAGHQAELFMHAPRSHAAADLLPGRLSLYETARWPGALSTETSRIAAARRLVEAVRAYEPDIIYLRYGIYVYPAHQLMAIAPTVEEINTNDLAQHEGLGKVAALYNRATRGVLLRRVCGLVAVSRELAVSPAFATYHKPTRTIANGIDLNGLPLLPAPNNRIPRIAFLGSPGNPWHGVDKLMALATDFPDIQLDIIGYDSLAEYGTVPHNVTVHGFLRADVYERVLGAADIAISSLALHRVQLNEASPLKSRECLAYGLPLVMAYEDTDLDLLSCEFLLRVPNSEGNIRSHGAEIRNFAYQMRGQRADRKLLGAIDQRAKEEQRLNFFKEVIRGEVA
jgi:hypothetical protein